MASGAYTHTQTHTLADESDYKKPGVPAAGLKIIIRRWSFLGMPKLLNTKTIDLSFEHSLHG